MIFTQIREFIRKNEEEKAVELLQEKHKINKKKAEILLEQFKRINVAGKTEIPRKVTPTGLDVLSDKDFSDFFHWFFSTFTFNIESEKFIDKNNLLIVASNPSNRIVVYANRNNPSVPVDHDTIKSIFNKIDVHKAGKGIVITSSYFTQNAILEAKNLNVELWDYNTFEEKIKSLETALKKSSEKVYLPEFEKDLVTTLPKLDNQYSLYIETKNDVKYYIRKRGVKNPLVTYHIISGKVEKCFKCVNEKTFEILRDRETIEINTKDEQKAYEELKSFLSVFV